MSQNDSFKDFVNMVAFSDKRSIKYSSNNDGVSSFNVDRSGEEYVAIISDKISNQCCNNLVTKPQQVLSMAEFTSAVGLAWDAASQPLSFSQHKETNTGGKKEKLLRNFGVKGNWGMLISSDSDYLCVDMTTTDGFPPLVKPRLDFPKIVQKVSGFESSRKNQGFMNLFQVLCHSRTQISNECWKNEGFVSMKISSELRDIYQWTNRKAHCNNLEPENTRNSESILPGNNVRVDGDSAETNTTALVSGGAGICISSIGSNSLQSSKDMKLERGTIRYLSLYSDYFAGAVKDTKLARIPCSKLCSDYHINSAAICRRAFDECRHKNYGSEMLHDQRDQSEKSLVGESGIHILSSARRSVTRHLAQQKHAVAGALAGTFVSLCLHPVDTIKTVVQSCHSEHRSLFYTSKAIVSDRGIPGLYRGIATNIASSAPISAVYTFTYESVKASLIPLFPMECHSFAHCMAGGCASIATSFIFTPSERVKQQMQVGSHYRNCWDAIIGIIRKGGLSSLYAGWVAVLCRNVPHSVIKFYTYESLKQMMLSSLQSSSQLNTLQTLVCGGLAGSTAALFTTPFDVVKTRLQTQIPGSTNRYGSVLHILYSISRNEGFKGLYRGLTPRLVMYMSQGALFFASYELLKRTLSLEASQTASVYNDENRNYPNSLEIPIAA